MHVVAAADALERLEVLADLGGVDVVGRGLQEDLGCGEGQGKGLFENDECDEEGHGGVGVVLPPEFGEPDDEGRGDDANVAEGVADDVQDHGVHAHVAMTVPVTLFAGLLGFRVVVVVVDLVGGVVCGWRVVPGSVSGGYEGRLLVDLSVRCAICGVGVRVAVACAVCLRSARCYNFLSEGRGIDVDIVSVVAETTTPSTASRYALGV